MILRCIEFKELGKIRGKKWQICDENPGLSISQTDAIWQKSQFRHICVDSIHHSHTNILMHSFIHQFNDSTIHPPSLLSIHSPIHPFIYSCIYPSINVFIPSLTHPVIQPCMHTKQSIHWSTHPSNCALNNLLISLLLCMLNPLQICPLIQLVTYSLIHLLTYAFIN